MSCVGRPGNLDADSTPAIKSYLGVLSQMVRKQIKPTVPEGACVASQPESGMCL